MDMKREILQPKKKASAISTATAVIIGSILAAGVIFIFANSYRAESMPAQELTIEEQIDNLRAELQSIKQSRAVRVRLTSYNSVPEQTDGTPCVTAINTRCRPGIVAVSRDLLEAGWTYGKKVWIEGYGVYVIEDIMDSRFIQAIDIWLPRGRKPIGDEQVLAAVVEW